MKELMEIFSKPFKGEPFTNDDIKAIKNNSSFFLSQLKRVLRISPRLNSIFVKLLDNNIRVNRFEISDIVIYFLSQVIPEYFKHRGEFNISEIKSLLYTKNTNKTYSHKILENKCEDCKDSFTLYYIYKYREYNSLYGKYCFECPLRHATLPKVGPKEFPQSFKLSDVMFVGINPGMEEAKQGEPFIGAAGQLLRKYTQRYLDKNNISYIFTNNIKCSAPNQQKLNSIAVSNNTTPEEIFSKFCSNYIIDEIKRYKPKVIVVLGKGDNKNIFLQSDALSKLIEEKNIKVFYLTHPSKYIRENNESPEEYNAFFKQLVGYLTNYANYSDDSSNNNNFTILNSPKEIPENQLLLDINILENENMYLFVTTDKDTHEVNFYKIPFYTEVIYSDKPGIRENEFIENIENLNTEIATDYSEYRKLLSAKLREFEDYIENYYQKFKNAYSELKEFE